MEQVDERGMQSRKNIVTLLMAALLHAQGREVEQALNEGEYFADRAEKRGLLK